MPQDGDQLGARLKRTEIQHASSSIPGRDVGHVLTEIPVDVSSGWHHHPGEEVGYIGAGTVRMQRRDGDVRVLSAGEGFLIPPGVPHNAPDVGPDTGRMLSTYLVESDAPIATLGV